METCCSKPHQNVRPVERSRDRCLDNGMSKSIVYVIEHPNFQFYRAYPTNVNWKNQQLMANFRQFQLFTSNYVSVCLSNTLK